MQIYPKDNLTIQNNLHRLLPFKARIRNFERFLDGKQLPDGALVLYGMIGEDTIKTLLQYKDYKNIKSNISIGCLVSVDTSFPIMKRFYKNYNLQVRRPCDEIGCQITTSDIVKYFTTETEFLWDLYLEFDSLNDLVKFKLTM